MDRKDTALVKRTSKIIAAGAMLACACAAFAQNPSSAAPQNVVQLSATGTVEVEQDLLVLTLGTSKEAADAATVQAQLKQALDAALAEAKRQAQPGQLDVRTGPFGLYPRYNKDGKISPEEFANFREGNAKVDAQATKAGKRGQRLFSRFDADKDGSLSRAEADKVLAWRYKRMDANNDGILTLEELQAKGGKAKVGV